MEYKFTTTKREVIIKKLKMLIDYKTLIAFIFLIVGYFKYPIFIFLGALYFFLYLIILIKSLLMKQEIISLYYVLEEDELIGRVGNQ